MVFIPVAAATAVVVHRRRQRRREQEAQQVVIGTPAYTQVPLGVAPPSTTGAYPQAYPMGGPGYLVMEGTPVVGVPVGAPVYGQGVAQGVSGRDLRRAHKQERREERREYRTERRALKAEIRAQRHAGQDIRRVGGFQPQTVYVQPSVDVRTAQQFAFTEREDDAGFMLVDQHVTPPPPTAPTYVAPMPGVYDPYAQATAPVSTCAV